MIFYEYVISKKNLIYKRSMQRNLRIISILITAILFPFPSFAAEPQTYSPDQVYRFFAQYRPEDIVQFAQKAANFFTPIAQQANGLSKVEEEKLFRDGLDRFHKLPGKFQWSNSTFYPYIIPQRCDQNRVVAHPIKKFFKVMSTPGFLKKYKDTEGRHIGMEICRKLHSNPQGVWILQKQWWPQTSKPMNMGLFLISIPGTAYQVQSYYPSRSYTEEELNQFIP